MSSALLSLEHLHMVWSSAEDQLCELPKAQPGAARPTACMKKLRSDINKEAVSSWHAALCIYPSQQFSDPCMHHMKGE